MKKIYILALMAIFAVSCGTTKTAVSPTNNGDVAIAQDPCEEYALLKPAQRAYGVGMHFQEMTARNQAELQARAALAKALQTCIETTIKDYAESQTKFAANDQEGQSITDQAASLNDSSSGMAKELIKGASVVKTSKYRTANNQYKVYVCVEYSEGVPEMAAKVAKTFNDMLTADQKSRIKFNEQQFIEQQKKAFENYKGATMQ